MHDEALSAESSTEHMEEHIDDRLKAGTNAPEAPQVSEAQPTSARISDQPRARFQRPMRRGGRAARRAPRRPSERTAPPHTSTRIQTARAAPASAAYLRNAESGQEIIVQIAKEPLGKKGARITSHVALPGRFLVYMPTVDHIGVSRRIGSAEDRSRLRRVVTEAKGTFPGGFIVRTAAAGASDDEIRADVEFLGRTWDTIRASSEQRHAPSLLHRDLNLVERILRDYLSDDYGAIWLDNEEEFSKVVEFVGRFQPKMVRPREAVHQRMRRFSRNSASSRSSTRRCARKCGSNPAAISSSTTPKRLSRSTSTPASTWAAARRASRTRSSRRTSKP